MNNQSPTKCLGIFGTLFGHKYQARYSTKEKPHFSPKGVEIAKRADLRELIDDAMQGVSTGAEIDAVQAFVTDDAHYETESVYVGEVCSRCGDRIPAEPQPPISK